MIAIHPCENCPMIDCQINWNWFETHDYDEEEVAETVQSCCCDKLDGLRIRWSNPIGCDDYPEPSNRKKLQHNNKRNLNKRERDEKYHHKLEQRAKLYHGCYVKDEQFIRGVGYIPVDKPYIKEYCRRKISKYLKRQSNKKVRRYKHGLSGRSDYKRLYDYWWKLD